MQTTETEKLQWIGVIAISLGIIQNVIFWGEGAGLNFPLFILLILGAFWFLNRKYNGKINKTTAILSLLVVFFSVMVFVRSSILLTFFNIVGTGLLLLIIVNSQIGKKFKEYLPFDYLKIFILPLYFIPSFFEKLSELFALKKLEKYSPKTKEVIRGTIIALIALAIFTWLFASADIVFGKIVKGFFSFQLDPTIVGRLIMFGFVTAFFLGVFGYMFRKSIPNIVVGGEQRDRSLGVIETKIFLASINVLFFIFIVFQLAYLFGGESHILSQGITYAEYARKGFFELLFVAFLTYLVILFTEQQVVKKENNHLTFFKILSSILVGQVVVILISAFVRLALYEHAYGFSIARLYSHALMIWVGIVLILLSHYIITNSNRAKFCLRVFCSAVLLLASMNLLNPDAFIAKLNMERYRQTGEVDAAYLGSLSYDALPYTYSLLDDPNEIIRRQFAHELYRSIIRDSSEPEVILGGNINNDSWKSNRLVRSRASDLLAP